MTLAASSTGDPDRVTRVRAGPPADRRTLAVERFFAVQLIALVVLQKLAIQIGGGSLELPFLLFFAGIAALVVRGAATVDLLRLVTFTAFMAAVLLSVMLAGRDFAPGALVLFLLLYVPLIFVADIDRRAAAAIARVFVATGVVVAGLVFAEQVANYTIGHRFWPNLEAIVPASLLFPGFNYLQPMSWGSTLIKPNAIVFLEVSYVSQFLALAIVAEIVAFRRPLILAILAGALMLTFAGTGLLLLALMVPFLIGRVDARLIVASVIVGMVTVAIFMTTQWGNAIIGRMGEFTMPNSSGYQRFTAPLLTTLGAFGDPAYLLTGLGPGNVPTANQNPLPVTKLVTEYGVLTTITFYAMFCTALFYRARSKVLATALFLFFNLGGGSLSVPLCVLLCVLLGTIAPRRSGSGRG